MLSNSIIFNISSILSLLLLIGEAFYIDQSINFLQKSKIYLRNTDNNALF